MKSKCLTLFLLSLSVALAAADVQASNSPAISIPSSQSLAATTPPPLSVTAPPVRQDSKPNSTTSTAPDYTKYAAIVISIATLLYTYWKDRKTEVRLKTVEQEQEREKAEAAIRRSKASAPYFTPSKKLFGILYEETENGGISGWHGPNVLSIQQKEIPENAPKDSPVIMVLDTGDKGARRISVSGDIADARLKQEPDLNDAHGLVFLKYPYTPANRGKVQKVILSFETEDGLELTHTYQTRHGHCEFYRIDPK